MTHLYLGCYGSSIFRTTLDGETGELAEPVAAGPGSKPTFLALHPHLPVLYAADETDGEGGVAAFSIDEATKDLTFINRQTHGGGGTCYVSVAADGKTVLAADYGGGSVAAFPVEPDGSLSKRSFFDQHEGSGPHESRQDAAHAHCFQSDPVGRFALSCDLGTDEIYVYRVDPNGNVSRHEPARFMANAGSGPRHVAWAGERGKHLYVLGELDNTLMTYTWDADRGTAELVQTVPLLPTHFDRFSKAAEVAVHPTGKFVYGSNRGHESIAVFERDIETGELTLRGHASCGGEHPRHFALSPDGRHLVVANQDSGNVVVLDVCSSSGELTPSASAPIAVAKAVCVRFL